MAASTHFQVVYHVTLEAMPRNPNPTQSNWMWVKMEGPAMGHK